MISNVTIKYVLFFGISLCLDFMLMAQEVKYYSCINVKTESYFQNGHEDWISYLRGKVNSYTPYANCAPTGIYCVEVRFLVERNGKLVDIKALTKAGFGMEEEVVRVVREAPNWIPATQNGKKCRSYECASYIFVVEDSSVWL